MRHVVTTAVIAFVISLSALPASAQNAGSIEGFGGLSFSADGDTFRPNVGGTLAVTLTPNIHAIGEGGRLANVMSPLADTVFSLTDAGIQASALYVEGGIRLVGAPNSTVSPYAEATAGVARLSVRATGLGTIGNVALPIAVGFLPRTGPVAGVGAGFVVRAGAMQFDLGYRFKQLYPPDALGIALGLGQELRSQQVRLGIGVRF
jgi:hypothetical protein